MVNNTNHDNNSYDSNNHENNINYNNDNGKQWQKCIRLLHLTLPNSFNFYYV